MEDPNALLLGNIRDIVQSKCGKPIRSGCFTFPAFPVVSSIRQGRKARDRGIGSPKAAAGKAKNITLQKDAAGGLPAGILLETGPLCWPAFRLPARPALRSMVGSF
jgi:hypothetical protein